MRVILGLVSAAFWLMAALRQADVTASASVRRDSSNDISKARLSYSDFLQWLECNDVLYQATGVTTDEGGSREVKGQAKRQK